MSDTPSPSYLPPDYEIVRFLGSGQTSNVFLATHPRRGTVALKIPKVTLHDFPVLRRMFENEVQITTTLKNPNIVTAYDGFPTGEEAYLVLEFCAGGTLDRFLLTLGKVDLPIAFQLILDVANGLEHTHTKKILHRDVKPANVFLTEQGRAKLGDFGTGMFFTEFVKERVGTAFYMAPEIFQGEQPSVRSDIYSLGILAYEVLTGVRPFYGETYETIMMAHVSGFPKNPRHYREDIPPEVVSIISTAMSRDAGKRYSSVASFIKAWLAATRSEDGEELIVGRGGRPKGEQPKVMTGRDARKAPNRMPVADEDEEVPEDAKGGLFSWFRRKK